MDFGEDTGTPVVDDYAAKTPYELTGQLNTSRCQCLRQCGGFTGRYLGHVPKTTNCGFLRERSAF